MSSSYFVKPEQTYLDDTAPDNTNFLESTPIIGLALTSTAFLLASVSVSLPTPFEDDKTYSCHTGTPHNIAEPYTTVKFEGRSAQIWSSVINDSFLSVSDINTGARQELPLISGATCQSSQGHKFNI